MDQVLLRKLWENDPYAQYMVLRADFDAKVGDFCIGDGRGWVDKAVALDNNKIHTGGGGYLAVALTSVKAGYFGFFLTSGNIPNAD